MDECGMLGVITVDGWLCIICLLLRSIMHPHLALSDGLGRGAAMFLGECRPIMAAFVRDPILFSMHHVSLLLLLLVLCQ